MTTLTERAEQALLGALLTEPHRFMRLPRMEAPDFTVPANRDVYAAVADAITRRPGQAPMPEVAAAVAGREYPAQLQRACPVPEHAHAYARLVIEAALRRRLADHASRLMINAANMHGDTERLTSARPGDAIEELLHRDHLTAEGTSAHPPVSRLLGHELELAAALRAHALAFDPGRETPHPDAGQSPEQPPASLPAQDQWRPGAISGNSSIAAAIWGGSTARTHHDVNGRDRQAHEERVLASILQGHATSQAILGWLPVEAMTGPRNYLYVAIVTLTSRAEPVDPLTADWELARRLAMAGRAGSVSTSYAAQLASTTVHAAPALHAAHGLLREYSGGVRQAAASGPGPAGTTMTGLEQAPAWQAVQPASGVLLPPPSPIESGPGGPEPWF